VTAVFVKLADNHKQALLANRGLARQLFGFEQSARGRNLVPDRPFNYCFLLPEICF